MRTSFLLNLMAKAGAHVAARYQSDFDALYVRLAQFPESGSRRRALGQKTRIGVVWPYKVIHEYTQTDDTVVVLRIVHGRRRITRQMLTP